MSSLLVGSILLDVEILDLIVGLVGGDNVQEFSKTVLLEVLLGQVLKISLGEGDIGVDVDDFVGVGDLDAVTQFTDLSVNLDSLSEELSEVAGVEDLVLNGSGAVDGEVVVAGFGGLGGWHFCGFGIN
jgi:hypothetical protein